jgi:hypothetical protein
VVTLALGVVAGLLLGLLRRPAGQHVVRPRVERIGLLAIGGGLNALSVILDGDAATFALMASLAVLIAVAFANRHLTGIAVVGLGLLVNLVAVAVNAGMPVRVSALEAAGVIDPGEAVTVASPRHIETDDDPLPVLGDIIPVPLTNEVVSFGDLIVVLGAADAVRELSRRRVRSRAAALAYRPARIASTSVDQVWGMAPSGSPVSATQCSENPDWSTPATIDLTKAEATEREPELVAASQSR